MTDPLKILEKAKTLGSSAELYSVRRAGRGIRRENQYYGESLREEGYGLRVFKDGKVGFSYSTEVNDELLERALSSMKASEPDEDNVPPPYSKPRYLNLRDDFDVHELPKEIVDSLIDLKDQVNLISIDVEAEEVSVKVVSTEGVDVEETRTGIYVSVMANHKEPGVVSPEIWEGVSSRFRKHIDIDALKLEVVEKVKRTVKRDRLDRKPKAVSFTPKAVASLLGPLLSTAINGENVFRKRSPLKPGELYGRLTLVDDPEDVASPYSRSFDGEGQLTHRNTLLENGVFRGPLTNWYWSKKLRVENTCSAVRSFSTVPSVGVSTLDLEHPEKADEEPGTLVVDQVQGVHTSNWETGEFGVVASVNWYVHSDGVKGVRESVISGNLKSLLNGITGTYGDKRRYTYVKTSHLVVEGLNVVY